MTTNKLVTIRISYTWKAHTPGPMSLMRFHFDECLNCCLHGWSQHYSGCCGLPDLSVLITEDASSPIHPGAWMQRLFGSPGGRATHTMAANIVPTRKEVVFIFLTAFNNVSAARPEERKKSLKEIWKLTSEAPWEIRGTNTWLFSFSPTLYWDDRTGWFVLKGGSYWDMFLFGTFMSSLEDFDWNT